MNKYQYISIQLYIEFVANPHVFQYTLAFVDTGVTVNAAYPGITKSDLGRHLSVNKSYISSFFMKPINYVVMRTLEEGAATPVFCAIGHDVRNTTGKLF